MLSWWAGKTTKTKVRWGLENKLCYGEERCHYSKAIVIYYAIFDMHLFSIVSVFYSAGRRVPGIECNELLYIFVREKRLGLFFLFV